jgi:hypothetical protein
MTADYKGQQNWNEVSRSDRDSVLRMVNSLQLRIEQQRSPVADEVSAITAIVRPILEASLYSLNRSIVDQLGGEAKITLEMLARVYKPGDGDCGICFEWAVHDAIKRKDAPVYERIADAIKRCKVAGGAPASILFGGEKSGALRLIDTAKDLLTNDSRVLGGKVGRPPKLKNRLSLLANALHKPVARYFLPQSISGLWKADLFLGDPNEDRWIGTSVKVNPAHVEGATGLRVAIVPSRQGKSDKISVDEAKNIVLCPLPYDGAFMELFYRTWNIVRQFFAASATCPKEVSLPLAAERQVARTLESRRSFPVVDVIEAMVPECQPELLETSVSNDTLTVSTGTIFKVEAVVAPKPRIANRSG